MPRYPMPNLYDMLYFSGVAVSSPVWLLKGKARRKVFAAFQHRMGHVEPRTDDHPLVLIHAVSLGEINATRRLVEELAGRRADLRFIVTSTTDTGYARGLEIYRDHPHVRVLRFPLDFSAAVGRLLDATRPCLAILMELEVWPNFMSLCHQRRIPVALLNGRVTEGSYRSYRRAAMFTKTMFSRLQVACVQEAVYAERFAQLGVPADRIRICGTMKFDTAQIAESIPGDRELADSLGLAQDAPLWVCGSTGPGEEAIALDVYARLREKHPTLRLAIIPRQLPRFDEVAQLIRDRGLPLVRRSEVAKGLKPALSPDAVLLGDTMGELRKFYSLASVVFVGRSLVDLGKKQHGSDMIEPCALAKPVAAGPYTTNFAEVMNAFRAQKAIADVATADELFATLSNWLSHPAEARALAGRAQEVVRQQQGATARQVDAVRPLLPAASD